MAPFSELLKVDVAAPAPFVARRRAPPATDVPVPGVSAIPPRVTTPPGTTLVRSLSAVAREHFGILAPLIVDARVTDVLVNGRHGVWIDRGSGLVRVPGLSQSEEELRALAVRLISLGGRHIDEANPCVDTRLGEGIRVHAVLPPVSTAGTLISVRLPSPAPASLDWLEKCGLFTVVTRKTVEQLVISRQNVLITGAGGSGKTTLLAAMLSGATSTERIIAIEDVAELRVDHPHFVALEARQANLEGAGAIGLAQLVREALRMRPDRLVLGECRGAEIREMLAALNTGHDGGAGTLHANSLADVPARLEALGALAGMSTEAVARQTVSAIGAVLHLARSDRAGRARRLEQLGTFAVDVAGRLSIVQLMPPVVGYTPRGRHLAGGAR